MENFSTTPVKTFQKKLKYFFVSRNMCYNVYKHIKKRQNQIEATLQVAFLML